MRKSSKLAILLAFLLSSTVVFSACDSSSMEFTGGNAASSVSPSVEEQQMNEIYKTRLDSWMKYIDYKAPETVANAKLYEEAPLTTKETDLHKADINNTSKVLIIEERDETEVTKTVMQSVPNPNPNWQADGEEQFIQAPQQVYDYSTYKTAITVQSIETGETLWTGENREAKSGSYAYGAEVIKYRPNKVVYTIDTSKHTAFFEVAKTTWTMIMPAPDSGIEVDDAYKSNPENYIAMTTYSYYDSITGEPFVPNSENLEDALTIRDDYLDFKDKTYLLGEDGIVKTFELGMEYNLPSFNKENTQLTEYADYVYFEQGEYGYRIDEAELNAVGKVGDLTLVICPEVSVSVYKSNELVATYTTDCYTITGYGVLPNGNVYICEWRLINDETKADIKLENYNIDVVHTLLDVTTGAVSEVNNAFTAKNVYTNFTEEIKTYLNVNTTLLNTGVMTEEQLLDRKNHMQGLYLKDGYVLAEIQKFENGALQGNTAYAILNANTLEVVEELPKLVDSQFGYAGYISESEVLFAVRTMDNKILRYTVNTETGDMELFTKNGNSIEYLTADTFIYKSGTGVAKIYDYEWNEIADLTEVYGNFGDYVVLGNGKLLIRHQVTSGGTEGYEWSIAKLQYNGYSDNYYGNDKSESSYRLEKEKIHSFYNYSGATSFNPKADITMIENGYFSIKNEYSEYNYSTSSYNYYPYVTYFDLDGNELFTTKPTIENTTKRESEDSSSSDYWKRVEYKVSTGYSVYRTLADGSVIVKHTIKWTETNRYGYGDSEQPTNYMGGKTYDQYFILK